MAPETMPLGFFYMKFSTSLAFINGGAGLLAALRKWPQVTLAAGVVVFLIGGITLFEYGRRTKGIYQKHG